MLVGWTEGVDVRDVVSELEFNDCDAETLGCDCAVFVEEAADADSGEEGLAGVVVACVVGEESVNDGTRLASTVSTAKVLPLESTSIC